MPQGLPTVSPALRPLVPEASSPHLSYERSNLELHRGSTRYSDTFGAHASPKLSLRGFPGKAAGQHRRSPRRAVPRAGPEASACCCGKGQHWELSLTGVGSCAQWGRQGRTRQAQFCWWGAWAPWVLRADEGPGSEQAPGPRRGWLPGLGAGSGYVWQKRQWTSPGLGAFNSLGPGGRLGGSLHSSVASGRPGQRAAGPLGAPLLECPLGLGLGLGAAHFLAPDGPQLGAPRHLGDSAGLVLILKPHQLPPGT